MGEKIENQKKEFLVQGAIIKTGELPLQQGGFPYPNRSRPKGLKRVKGPFTGKKKRNGTRGMAEEKRPVWKTGGPSGTPGKYRQKRWEVKDS